MNPSIQDTVDAFCALEQNRRAKEEGAKRAKQKDFENRCEKVRVKADEILEALKEVFRSLPSRVRLKSQHGEDVRISISCMQIPKFLTAEVSVYYGEPDCKFFYGSEQFSSKEELILYACSQAGKLKAELLPDSKNA